MSDENTARHAECTVEFDGVDITSSTTTKTRSSLTT